MPWTSKPRTLLKRTPDAQTIGAHVRQQQLQPACDLSVTEKAEAISVVSALSAFSVTEPQSRKLAKAKRELYVVQNDVPNAVDAVSSVSGPLKK